MNKKISNISSPLKKNKKKIISNGSIFGGEDKVSPPSRYCCYMYLFTPYLTYYYYVYYEME